MLLLLKNRHMRTFFRFHLLIFILAAGNHSIAQSNAASAYQSALDQTVLLKNNRQQIPLQGLERLRILVLQSTPGESPVFLETLKKYMELRTAVVPDQDIENWILTQTQQYHFFILGLSGLNPPGKIQEIWKALRGKASAAVVLFEPSDLLRQYPALEEADVIITAPGSTEGQSLAAQAIFGGTALHARLAEARSDNFPAGAGLDIPQATRLGYAPAEIAGMNTALLADSIAAIIQQGLDSMAFPGAQVLVAHEGKVVYHEVFGTQAYESDDPVRKDDLYDLASVTKISASVPVLMEWYGQGKLDLDAPLVRYLPEVKGSNKADLSMRRILTHTAQLMAFIPFWRGTLKGQSRNPWQKHWNGSKANDFRFKARTFRSDSSRAFPVYVTDQLWMHRKYDDALYRSIYQSPLNKKPGFVYSDFFFTMMPRVVRAQTGIPFDTYVKTHFYQPLGASTITFNPLRNYSADRIIPTERDTFFRMKQLRGTVHDEAAAMLGGVSGHAGLFASVNDLAKLMQMYLNFGTYGGKEFIAAAAVQEFIRCQYCDSEGIHRGIGFDKPRLTYNPNVAAYAPQASASSFGHTGYTGTYTWMDPESNLLVIVCTNRVFPTRDNNRLGELSIRRRVHEAAYLAMKKE